MEGASATALIKKDWQYGGSRQKIRQNITYGIASAEMPAFKHILSEEAIDTLSRFILEAQNTQLMAERKLPQIIETRNYSLDVSVIEGGALKIPWAIEFVNHRLALVSCREGSLHWLRDGQLDSTKIDNLPKPYLAASTAGFMDIALDPDYDLEPWIYLSFSHSDGAPDDKEAPALTKIVRGKIVDYEWTEEETLFEVPERERPVGGNRWGCRLIFDQQKRLYFSIGDMALAEDSQDLTKPTGKVFRINRDGSIPQDNPFVDVAGALPQVFTLGNRNVQGLTWHPQTGLLWASEHGPMGGDEINILEAGANHGWPIATYGLDYSGDTITTLTESEGMTNPITQWTPSPGVCGIEFCTSPLFQKWHNNLLVGALALQELRLLKIADNRVLSEEIILKNLGRIRDVKFGPDGDLYVVVNGPDMILRIVPKPSG